MKKLNKTLTALILLCLMFSTLSGIIVSVQACDSSSKLVFTAGAGQSLTAGVVSPTPIVVQCQDASGTPVSGTSKITVSLSTSSSGGVFYSNSGGTTVITSIVIAAGSSSSAGFYYKDTVAGNPTLTGASSGLTSATTKFTIIAAGNSKLVFTAGGSQSLTAGVVSPTAIVVQRQDQYGNAVSAGTSKITVSLSTSSSGGVFYSNSGGTTVITSIVIAAGSSSSAGFYYKDTVDAGPTLTGESSGLTSATTQFTIGANSASQFVFTAISAQTAGSFGIMVSAEDQYGNLVTSYSGMATLTDTSGTITPVSVTFVGGVWSGDVTVTLAGSDAITATDSSLDMSGTSNTFTVAAGSASQFVFNTIGAQTFGSAFSIMITAKDQYGNTATSYTGTPTLTDLSGTMSRTSTPIFVGGVWSGDVTVTLAGSDAITATDGTITGTSNTFTVTHTSAAESSTVPPGTATTTVGGSPTATPTSTPTPMPTATPTSTPTPMPTATPTSTPTPMPTATPLPAPVPTPLYVVLAVVILIAIIIALLSMLIARKRSRKKQENTLPNPKN